jgi:centrin-1
VSSKELQAAMDSFGLISKNRAIYLMISQLNSDGSSEIDFDQWISLRTPKAPITNIKAHYSRVFELYDD